MGVYEVLPSGALVLRLTFFTSFIKLFYINMCCDGSKHFHFFIFLLKSENTQFDRFANISYFSHNP